jgi:hypothetical protein
MPEFASRPVRRDIHSTVNRLKQQVVGLLGKSSCAQQNLHRITLSSVITRSQSTDTDVVPLPPKSSNLSAYLKR